MVTLKFDLALRLFCVTFLAIAIPYFLPISQEMRGYAVYYGELLLYALVLFAFQYQLDHVEKSNERKFWNYVTLAFASWLAARCFIVLVPETLKQEMRLLWVDVVYLLYYLFLLIAGEVRPDLQQEKESVPSLEKLKILGFIAFLTTLLTYFILIPSDLAPQNYDIFLPSHYLFVALDVVVLLRFFELRRICKWPRWRTIYGLIALCTFQFLMLDITEWFIDTGLANDTWGTKTDLIWALPLATIVLAARMRHSLPQPAEIEVRHKPLMPNSPLALLIIFLLMIHFLISYFDLFDSVVKRAQEITISFGFVGLGALAILEDSRLRKKSAAMELERTKAQKRDAAFTALGKALNRVTSAEEAARLIMNVAEELLGWDACVFDLYSEEKDQMQPILNVDIIQGKRVNVDPEYFGSPSPAARRTIQEGPLLVLGQASDIPLIRFGDKTRPSASRMFAPIRSAKKIIGVLSIQSYKEDAYDQEDLESLSALADYCGGALERLQIEEAMHQREEHFRSLIENVSDIISVLDSAGMFHYYSPSLERLLGYGANELTGKNAFDLIHPEDLPAVLQVFEQVIQNPGISRSVEHRYRHKTGSWLILESVGRNMKSDSAGVRVIVNSRDVTGRKAAEKAAQASEERYRRLFENSKDAIFISTPEGKILDLNRTALPLFGFSTIEEFFQASIDRDVYSNPEEHKQHQRIMEEQGYVRDYELTIKRKDGQKLTVLETSTANRDETGRIIGYEGIFRDITEIKQLQQQLLQSQKIETIGRLVGGIAHDFNNILMAIIGFCELIQMKMSSDGECMGDVNEIHRAAEQGGSLTRQLLAFGRKQLLAPKVLDLNIALKNMNNMLQRVIGEDIDLIQLLEPNLGRIKVDPGQLEQVIMNLAVNARDAMPSGGRLVLKTQNVNLDEEFVHRHLGSIAGPHILLTVTDTGHGMDEVTLSHIFEPFFTTKELGKGTGLGLSTVYGIIKQSGGYIWVESRVGQGTSFEIYFPRIDSALEATKPPVTTFNLIL